MVKTESEKNQPAPKKRQLKSFQDVYGGTEFYPDTEKRDFKTLIDKTYVLEDAKILKDFHSQFGIHDAALMMMSELENPDVKFTTINSGQVVLDRIALAIKERRLPLLVTPIETEGANGKYYNLT